jgi:motility quorum-sensing regulator / GCU-specific mRNA interferase toxin
MVLNTIMTEKRKPSHDLNAIRASFSTIRSLNATASAIRGAAALGFGRREIVETIQNIEHKHFYKSMTSYADHTAWQDVYHVPSKEGPLYIKFTTDVVTDFLLLSFKEKKDD